MGVCFRSCIGSEHGQFEKSYHMGNYNCNNY